MNVTFITIINILEHDKMTGSPLKHGQVILSRNIRITFMENTYYTCIFNDNTKFPNLVSFKIAGRSMVSKHSEENSKITFIPKIGGKNGSDPKNNQSHIVSTENDGDTIG